MQINSELTHDVLIIGSGASGGMAAHVLTQKGIKCLMLDAGPAVDLERNRVLRAVYDLPYRGFGKPGRFPHVTQANEFNANASPAISCGTRHQLNTRFGSSPRSLDDARGMLKEPIAPSKPGTSRSRTCAKD